MRRTGRAVVVHEASGFGGYGAEVAARLTEQCFHSLAAPVLRVTGFDVPYPPPSLEHHHLPNAERILDAVARLQWDDTPADPDPGTSAGVGVPDFLLPDLGEGLESAEIVAWHVAVGDEVAVDQVVVEVETAKAVVDVPVPFAGVVSALHARPGQTVAVGSPLVRWRSWPPRRGRASRSPAW